jgi:F-type H+-transporting ATPase subunit b
MLVAASNNILLPNATIIPEFLAFLVVLGAVAKYIVPRINTAIETRQRTIAESLKVIEEAEAKESAADNEAKALLQEARQQARSVVDNANRVAEELQSEARRRGEEEYARIIAQAEGEIERLRRAAESSLLEELSDLVVSTASRVVEAEINPERHQALIDEAIDAVTASANASGTAVK